MFVRINGSDPTPLSREPTGGRDACNSRRTLAVSFAPNEYRCKNIGRRCFNRLHLRRSQEGLVDAVWHGYVSRRRPHNTGFHLRSIRLQSGLYGGNLRDAPAHL